MSFVFDDSELPDGKEDLRPLTTPANKSYTAAEWNSICAAVVDVRSALLKAFGTITGGSGIAVDVDGDGDASINVAAASGGINVVDRAVGTLRVYGAQTLHAGTGHMSGTAGSGTSTSQLNKPAGGSNWVADALTDRFLKITGGGGFVEGQLTLRPIRSNTTTGITVDTVAGMSETTTFQIVDITGSLSQLNVDDDRGFSASACAAPIRIEGIGFDSLATEGLIDISDCADVVISGCQIALNTVQASALIQRCKRVRFEHCLFQDSADVEISDCGSVEITGCINRGGGQIYAHDCDKVTVSDLLSVEAPSTVLRLVRVRYAAVEAICTDGGATPIYIEDVARIESVGGHLTGSGNTGYGIEIAGNGGGTFVGSTITGDDGDVLYDDGGATHAVTWTVLSGSDYGRIDGYAGSFSAHVNSTKSIVYGNRLFDGSVDFSSRVLTYGYFNFAQATALTAAGTDASTALQLGAQVYHRLDTVAASTGVKLPNAAALPGVFAVVHNAGANTLAVYQPGGGAALTTIVAGAIKLFMSTSDNGSTWTALT